MNNRKLTVLSLLMVALTVGCSATVKNYEGTSPVFSLKHFFDGELKGWGLVRNRSGEVTRRFVVDMSGRWEGDQGQLYELFEYSNGETQERTWRFSLDEDGKISGSAEDVKGSASGSESGYAFYWKYNLQLDLDGREIVVHLDDWIFQIDKRSVISHARIQKFGIEVGEVIVFIQKQVKS